MEIRKIEIDKKEPGLERTFGTDIKTLKRRFIIAIIIIAIAGGIYLWLKIRN